MLFRKNGLCRSCAYRAPLRPLRVARIGITLPRPASSGKRWEIGHGELVPWLGSREMLNDGPNGGFDPDSPLDS